MVIALSVAVGVAGALLTRYLVGRLERARPDLAPDAYWALGVLGLLPAWLVEFVALLDRLGRARIPDFAIASWWTLSSAAAVVGVIAGHARLRRLAADEATPPSAGRCWLLGVLTLPGAWALATAGLLVAWARR